MEYLRQEMGITREGVSLKGICVAAREIGMQTTACRMSMGSLCEDVTLPCIIHWNQNHFVVVYKIAHGKVYVADPGKGMIHYSMAEGATDRAGSRTPMQEGTEKVPFFYDQNGKCLRFVTSLSANRLNKAKIDRK